MKHDIIKLALTQNRLDYIAQHMGWVMIRTSRSPIFNQSHDFSCFITDKNGVLISQADGIPIHTGGGGFSVRALLKAFSGNIHKDDAFLLNDPYVAGGNHLPDWVVAKPIFSAATVIGFACIRAHQSDIGGGAAGTYNAKATEIFDEGIRLPPLKLVESGQIRRDLWELLLINTRCPELLDGDLRAMLGATQVGMQEVAKIADESGVEETQAVFAEILDYGDRRMRAAVSEISDGVYTAHESYHDDCFKPIDVKFKLTLTKDGEHLTVDFTGTDNQITGFKNSSLANTYSAVYAAIASFFDADMPKNEGAFRCVEIIAPEGTVINATPPAPLTMCTVFPAYQIMHMVWWTLGQAAQERALAGWGKNAFPVTAGLDARAATWVMYNWGATSGGGASAERDGFNQIGPMVTLGGLIIPNAETYERLYPVRILRQEFRKDGGGAGVKRGGTGVEYEAEFLVDAEFSFRGEGLDYVSGIGVEGGKDGKPGTLVVINSDGDAYHPFAYGVEKLGPCRLLIQSPGGGGYGDPFERQPVAVLEDVRNGMVSVEEAREVYGIVFNDGGDSLSIDWQRSRILRETR